jgi:hypothetical protein
MPRQRPLALSPSPPFALSLSKGSHCTRLRQAQPERLWVPVRAPVRPAKPTPPFALSLSKGSNRFIASTKEEFPC